MEIDLLTFGIAREILGTHASKMQLAGAIKVEELKAALAEQYPDLKKLTSFMIAVNGRYAEAGEVIKPGDEVAIIPPVSGG